MSDLTSLQSDISTPPSPTASYKGESVGTFPVTRTPLKEKPLDPLPKMGAEISQPRDPELQKKMIRDGELLAQAGIILKTDETGTVLMGMTLPENLLADELQREAEEKGELFKKIETLEKELDTLKQSKKEGATLIENLQKKISLLSSQQAQPLDSSSRSPSHIPNTPLHGAILRPAIPTKKNWGAERFIARLLVKESTDGTPTLAPKQQPQAPQEIVKEEEVSTQKPSTPVTKLPQETPSPVNTSRETVSNPEEKKLETVTAIHTALISLRGNDWKKYIISPISSSVETPSSTSDVAPWRVAFADQQFLEDISTLDIPSFIAKHVDSDDQQFSEKITQATCFDIFNKETEKTLFGAPKGISVDAKEIDHRLEVRELLGQLSGLDEKAVTAITTVSPPESDSVYSSPNLTIGDYILHVKTNIAKADSAART